MIPPLPLILALIAVESGGNDRAVGAAGEVGCLQIRPCVIEDVNKFVRRPNFYKLADRENRAISMQILRRYLHRYASVDHLGRPVTVRDMALIWRFGPTGYRRRDKVANAYWNNVKKHL